MVLSLYLDEVKGKQMNNRIKKKKESKNTAERGKKGLVLTWIFLGIIFMAYFVGLILYAGFTNYFYFIWLFGGLGCFLFAWMAKVRFVNRFLPRWLKVFSGIVIGAGLIFFIAIEAFIFSGFHQTPSREVEYLIVLGAHVRDGRPSNVLVKRLDAAYDYAVEHENVTIIVSGGQGSNETTTEAFAMAAYLEEKGIDRERIILEEKSTNTDENLSFSKEYVEDGGRVAVVSNNFHIFRAVNLARHRGYKEPQGLAAKDDIRTTPANLLREFFGVLKDWFCGNMDMRPL